MCVTLQRDLDILHRLLAYRPGTGHLIRYILCSFLQLEIRGEQSWQEILVNDGIGHLQVNQI